MDSVFRLCEIRNPHRMQTHGTHRYMEHLPGKVMLADLLTKAVARVLWSDLLRLFDAYSTTGIVCPGV